ncbi:UbiA prenyltransferase family protein [Candidatus Micrarchaeota archaeon]|nr:UbiA prenyltransferase family protein [Candidatus Micrarchaeota archaeon]
MASSLAKALDSLFKLVDEYDAPWWQAIAVILACIAARSVFEGLLESGGTLWTLQRIVYEAPFYLSVLASIAGAVALLTRQRFFDVVKKSVFLIPVIILPPFLDFFVTGGKGLEVRYFTDPSLWLNNLLGFGITEGATLGIRLEGLIVCFFVAAYILYKTRSIWRAAAGAVAAHVVTYLAGYLPAPFLAWGQRIEDAQLGTLFLLSLLSTVVGAFLFEERKKLFAVLRNVRVLNSLHYALATVAGMFIALKIGPGFVPALTAKILITCAAALAAVFFSFQSHVWLNDLSDKEGDAFKKRKRPLFDGFSEKEAVFVAAAFAVLAFLFAFCANEKILVLVLAGNALAFLYSFGPRFKRVPILSSLVISLLTLLAMLAGFWAVRSFSSFDKFPLEIALTVVVAFTLSAGIRDLKDVQGDRKMKVYSLPVLLGERGGRIVTAVMVFAAFLCVPLLMALPALWPFALVLGAAALFFTLSRDDPEPWVYACYFAFFAALAWFYNFG